MKILGRIKNPAHSLESPVNKRCRCEIVRTEIGNTSGLLRMYSGSVKCCLYLKFFPVFPSGAGCFPVSCQFLQGFVQRFLLSGCLFHKFSEEFFQQCIRFSSAQRSSCKQVSTM